MYAINVYCIMCITPLKWSFFGVQKGNKQILLYGIGEEAFMNKEIIQSEIHVVKFIYISKYNEIKFFRRV